VSRRTYQGWISLYVAEERLQTILFNREIIRLQPQAFWKYPKAKLIRKKKTIFDRENSYSNRSNLTTEERLYQMGYFEKLKNKYFDDERFLKVVGEPRGFVQDYQPEVGDQCDEFD